ncbi:MAG TPA: hypothetical protein VGE97_05715 [Nitrososphaera sp.]|jgi:hypothetical protein
MEIDFSQPDKRDIRTDLGDRLLRLRQIFPNLPAHQLADMIERGEDVYEESLNGGAADTREVLRRYLRSD